MSKVKISFPQYLKSLRILHLGLMLAQLILIAIIFVLVNENKSLIDENNQFHLLILLPILVLFFIFSGRSFYQQKLRSLRLKTKLPEKLIDYRTIQIVQFAFAEAASLTCFFIAFLSQNTIFVYGSIGILIYFMSIRPGKSKLIKELQLDFYEQETLSRADFIVMEMETSKSDE